MNDCKTQLDKKKFREIYTNEKFRNEIASAHGCLHANGKEHNITCSYPVAYSVTEEQITQAKQERENARQSTLRTNKNKLLFIGMGMEYEPRFKDDVCNHRIRTEFSNNAGEKFFIELGTGKEDRLRIDHSINRTLQKNLNDSFDRQGEFYNWEGLERNTPNMKYTKQNVLNIVNKYYNCNFKEIIIDNYNLTTKDLTCQSPKKETEEVIL